MIDLTQNSDSSSAHATATFNSPRAEMVAALEADVSVAQAGANQMRLGRVENAVSFYPMHGIRLNCDCDDNAVNVRLQIGTRGRLLGG